MCLLMSLGPWYTNIAKSDLIMGHTGVQNVSSAEPVFLLKRKKLKGMKYFPLVQLPLCTVQESAYQPRSH